jgi:hypothetical protein
MAVHVQVNQLRETKRQKQNLFSGNKESLSLSLQPSKDDDCNMNDDGIEKNVGVQCRTPSVASMYQ